MPPALQLKQGDDGTPKGTSVSLASRQSPMFQVLAEQLCEVQRI